jgi:hypothetical protein
MLSVGYRDVMQYECVRALKRSSQFLLAALRTPLQRMRRPDLSTAVAAPLLCSLDWLLNTAKELTLINDDSLSSAALAMTL